MINACIFDLDGVLVDTARYHFLSWRKLASELHFTIEDEIEEQLKGISRMDSLEIILENGGYQASLEEKVEFARLKNEWYLDSINHMDEHETLPGVNDFLDELKKNNIGMAVGSASKNALTIIDKVHLDQYFKIIVDGNMVSKTKPDPEVFLTAAKSLDVKPENCIVFEDSYKGIEAANSGGFYSVGVGLESNLPNADFVIPGFNNLNLEDILTGVLNENNPSD
ncbi:MAG: beta-phosphoglucomutase [Saprospiraceae bacterium]|nr:beta-phosphoglucomutase [Saprospiraceae bacterium]NNK89924.1 beta-phosphoglucomutase [Saprospiraceae bacterium]